jgi:hypothetical protein
MSTCNKTKPTINMGRTQRRIGGLELIFVGNKVIMNLFYIIIFYI